VEKRDKINTFMEKNYGGDLRILHYLEILKKDIGFSQLKEKVKRPLTGIRAAAYYGCMLLRPFDEMEFDDKERPTIFEEFLEALGATAVHFPLKIECCGSFQSVGAPEVATECAYKILGSAAKNGAELLVSTCPCAPLTSIINRKTSRRSTSASKSSCPLFYAAPRIAMGIDYQKLGFEQNAVNPLPLLKEKGLL